MSPRRTQLSHLHISKIQDCLWGLHKRSIERVAQLRHTFKESMPCSHPLLLELQLRLRSNHRSKRCSWIFAACSSNNAHQMSSQKRNPQALSSKSYDHSACHRAVCQLFLASTQTPTQQHASDLRPSPKMSRSSEAAFNQLAATDQRVTLKQTGKAAQPTTAPI